MLELQEANKQAMRHLVEGYQSGRDSTVLEDVIAADVIDHTPMPGLAPGREGVRQIFTMFHEAFPDFRAEILDQVAEGDKVVTRKVFHGTHSGPLFGIPATGRIVQIDLIDIVRFSDGQIVEHWNVVDQLGLMRQLGALPA